MQGHQSEPSRGDDSGGAGRQTAGHREAGERRIPPTGQRSSEPLEHRRDAVAAVETDLTRESGRRLTLAYAAPEQVLGQPVGVACDIYALGVMLFELLTGQRPHADQRGRALEDEILRGQPRQPSAAAGDKTGARALRGDLDAIVLTALKREPGARYRSATALADDIDNYLTGRPVKARPDSRACRLRKFVACNRLPVAAGTAVVIAHAVGMRVTLWQADRTTALNTFLLSLIRQADSRVSQQTKAADLRKVMKLIATTRCSSRAGWPIRWPNTAS